MLERRERPVSASGIQVSGLYARIRNRVYPWIASTVPHIAEQVGLRYADITGDSEKDRRKNVYGRILTLGDERLTQIPGPFILAVNGPDNIDNDSLLIEIVHKATEQRGKRLPQTESIIHFVDPHLSFQTWGESFLRRQTRTLIAQPFRRALLARRHGIEQYDMTHDHQTNTPIIMHIHTDEADGYLGDSSFNTSVAALAATRNIPVIPVYIDTRNRGRIANPYESHTYVSFGEPLVAPKVEAKILWQQYVQDFTFQIAEGMHDLRQFVSQHMLYTRAAAKVLTETEALASGVNENTTDEEFDAYTRRQWAAELMTKLNERFDQLFRVKEIHPHHSPRALERQMREMVQLISADTQLQIAS